MFGFDITKKKKEESGKRKDVGWVYVRKTEAGLAQGDRGINGGVEIGSRIALVLERGGLHIRHGTRPSPSPSEFRDQRS